MSTLISILNRTFDLLFWPFQNLPPIFAVVFFALAAGVLMLAAFKYSSNQAAIRRAKDRLGAHLLEVRLFQDQLGVVLRAYLRILRAAGAYLACAFPPLVVTLLPLLLLLAQVELRLGREAAAPHAPVLVKVKLPAGADVNSVELKLPAGVQSTAPPLRIPEEAEVDWRIEAGRPGEFALEFSRGGKAFSKQFVAGGPLPRVSPWRTASALELLLYPGEERLDSATAQWVEITYPPREVRVLGWGMHWIVPFFVLTLAWGYALKGLFGVEF